MLLVFVASENGSAHNLSNVNYRLLKRSAPLNNSVGFGSDNCCTVLKDDVSSVYILGCVCHSFALCASRADSVLPTFLQSFHKYVISYFPRSAKRQRYFSLIQKVVNTVTHKIPMLAQARWLSGEKVATAILEWCDALVVYFRS